MRALLFTLTLFASAALLFLLQPFAGKCLLPWVGGSPAAWTTCLVFFQSLLLLGYLYADQLGRHPLPIQWLIHAVLALAALAAVLLIRPEASWIPTESDHPLLGVLAYLLALVGGPFLVLASTAPLLQRWYAAAGRRDPYFLYAASNAGSFGGLILYPVLIEPSLDLNGQSRLLLAWFGFTLLAVLTCGAVMFRAAPQAPLAPSSSDAGACSRRWWLWVALAAVPSSLLVSCTSHITTDLAPIPLLWVVPLALYLLSFVIVFSCWTPSAAALIGRSSVIIGIALAVVMLTQATEPASVTIGIHLLGLLAAGLLCHGQLALSRPAESGLTQFYLALSVGGVLGGSFNALLAPIVFERLGPVEYLIGLAAAALIRPGRDDALSPLRLGRHDLLYLTLLALLALTTIRGAAPHWPAGEGVERILRGLVLYGVPALGVFLLSARPARFALALALLLAAGRLDTGLYGDVLETRRNFFGTLRVTRSADGRMTQLVHGTTIHGQQWRDRPGPPEPLMYYHRKGPAGRFLDKRPAEQPSRVGVVGLGCGALAAYARPGEVWTFWEIDPGVARIAQDPRYFTFLSECPGKYHIVLGDARRKLSEEPDSEFDLLILDAFSSDAVPTHLLTREALSLYFRKLKPEGLLLFHVSNRYLDLPPLVAALAADHDPPCSLRWDETPEVDPEIGLSASAWAAVARSDDILRRAGLTVRWQRVLPPWPRAWTDGYSNLLAIWKRRE